MKTVHMVLLSLAIGAGGLLLPAQEKPKPVFDLTELQKTRLERDRQEVYRWQDKINDALNRFSSDCIQAQKENHWPAVTCNFQDLSVAAAAVPENAAPPSKAPPPAPAKPPDK